MSNQNPKDPAKTPPLNDLNQPKELENAPPLSNITKNNETISQYCEKLENLLN